MRRPRTENTPAGIAMPASSAVMIAAVFAGRTGKPPRKGPPDLAAAVGRWARPAAAADFSCKPSPVTPGLPSHNGHFLPAPVSGLWCAVIGKGVRPVYRLDMRSQKARPLSKGADCCSGGGGGDADGGVPRSRDTRSSMGGCCLLYTSDAADEYNTV